MVCLVYSSWGPGGVQGGIPMKTSNNHTYIAISHPSESREEISSMPRLVNLILIDLVVAMLLTLGAPVFASSQGGEKASFAEKFTGFMSGILTGETVSKPSPAKSTRLGSRSGWLYSHQFQLASRGELADYPAMDMEATAYEPSPISCGPHANGITATGMRAVYGVVAVDPRVIPLGSRLYVEGYGYAIAADTGSAIKGNRIDLFYPTYREAIQFGRRMVRVYLLAR